MAKYFIKSPNFLRTIHTTFLVTLTVSDTKNMDGEILTYSPDWDFLVFPTTRMFQRVSF
jgi:hypothetical protein